MIRLYIYRIKNTLQDKVNMFWTLCFPLLLGTFFFLAFSSVTARSEALGRVPVAVVQLRDNSTLNRVLASLGEGDDPVLAITEAASENEALALLDSGDVAGVLLAKDTPQLVFKEEGIEQSLLKSIFDRYLQIEATITTIVQTDPAALTGALESLTDSAGLVREVPLLKGNSDYMTQYFYALIAMTCLFSGFYGVNAVRSTQASLSALGIRRSAAPTKKGTLIASDFLASLTLGFGGCLLLLLYLSAILGVDIGANWGGILLLCFAGCGSSVLLGMIISVLIHSSEAAQDGVLIAASLALSFLAGLMYQDMRHVVEGAAPILNRINPASLIVDSLYALDAYGMGQRFWMNMAWLAAVMLVLAAGCVAGLRRKRYASV